MKMIGSYDTERSLTHWNVSPYSIHLYFQTTAVELLKYARDERGVNINATPLYIDASTGSILSNRPIQEDLGLRQLVSIPIPDRPYKYNEYVEVAVSSGNTQYRRILKKKLTTYVWSKKVPFDIFEEVKPLDEP